MADVVIAKLNDSFGYVISEDVVLIRKLYESLSFWVPGYKFMPSYQNGWFDGKVHLMELSSRTFPLGLSEYVYEICKNLNYSVDVEKKLLESFSDNFFNKKDVLEFFNNKKFFVKKEQIFPREDQLEATLRAISSKRCVNICPTSFGKSISITMECLWFISKGYKCLIIVPTKDLVDQFANDILDYATSEDGIEDWYPNIQKIYAGKEKILLEDTDICISTWQSLMKISSEEYMNQFDVVILDECHKSAAQKLQEIMNNATSVKYRTGWTGTLSEETINELQIKGIFGPVKNIISTKELMDKGIVAQLSIVVARVQYPEDIRYDLTRMDYHKQTKFIEEYKERNTLLLNIIGKFNSTGLMLYRHISHGERLFNLAREMFPERNSYLVHGGYFRMNDKKYKNFEEIKTIIETEENGIVIGNYAVVSTGISIKNLHWLMFAAPVKSFITTVQGIGRVLRISKVKNKAILIDVVDDFSTRLSRNKNGVLIERKNGRLKENYAIKHFAERFQIYNMQKFDYRIHNMHL